MQDAPIAELVVASGNPKKLAEIAAVLGPAMPRLRLVPLPDAERPLVRAIPEPEETADTFAGNAHLKAAAYAQALGRPCLADDSGLVVDALGGNPGVLSARYAAAEFPGRWAGMTRAERDAANNARLLRELSGVPAAARTARFVCAICVVDASGRTIAACEGTFEGRIGEPPRVPAGAHGFGYDPLFLAGRDGARTSAEMDPAEKNALSHRGVALRRLAALLAG